MSIKSVKHSQSGFSVFELVMTLAILGIMGSFAITAFGSQAEAVGNTRDRRNAQEIAAVCTMANAAGLNFATNGQLDTTVRNIIQGAAPTSGAFKGHVFKVSLIGEPDIVGATRYLTIKNGELTYRNDS